MTTTDTVNTILNRVKGTARIERIPLGTLTVDLRVQQPIRETKVKEFLSRGYDEALVNMIVVSERQDSSRVILDGQTRAEAARRAGATHILAGVWSGLSLQDEAYLFTYLNKKSNPSSLSTFKTRIVAQEDVPTGIAKILNDRGWEINDSGNVNGRFSAVAAAERIYRSKGEFRSVNPGSAVFKRTIDTVTDAWGLDSAASDGAIITGVAVFLIRYWDEVDQPRLVRSLSRITATNFRAQSRTFQTSAGVRPAVANAYIVHKEYNKRGRSKLNAFAI